MKDSNHDKLNGKVHRVRSGRVSDTKLPCPLLGMRTHRPPPSHPHTSVHVTNQLTKLWLSTVFTGFHMLA